jgi:Arm DNA-binding domain
MTAQQITKRTVDGLQCNGREFTAWDDGVSGFGVRVRPTGAKSYVVVYRAGAGRGAPVRRCRSSASRQARRPNAAFIWLTLPPTSISGAQRR